MCCPVSSENKRWWPCAGSHSDKSILVNKIFTHTCTAHLLSRVASENRMCSPASAYHSRYCLHAFQCRMNHNNHMVRPGMRHNSLLFKNVFLFFGKVTPIGLHSWQFVSNHTHQCLPAANRVYQEHSNYIVIKEREYRGILVFRKVCPELYCSSDQHSRLTGAGPSLLNHPGLSHPCLSWNTQPASRSSCTENTIRASHV